MAQRRGRGEDREECLPGSVRCTLQFGSAFEMRTLCPAGAPATAGGAPALPDARCAARGAIAAARSIRRRPLLLKGRGFNVRVGEVLPQRSSPRWGLAPHGDFFERSKGSRVELPS